MQQQEYLYNHKGLPDVVVGLLRDDQEYLIHLVSLLPALGEDGFVVLQVGALVRLLDEGFYPPLGLGCHLSIQPLHFVHQ